ncbi:MAG: glutamate--tRNA ligase [Leptospiraceae bacterium]|nr:glutamate--tRNA ligase [Leptospiraceae bacterium]MDW7975982.1 glutamate--tRNA ligase [Leptospiraceae bacterium]
MEVRTRFAPSPTGFLHIGGARTALFNYLYAKARGGSFILRIEDTDQERSTKESERMILDALKWLGIQADEGPEEGGKYGPYRQSERLHIYKKYTDYLLEKQLAYRCFCSPEELEAKQERSKRLGIPHVYDGKCRNLSASEIEEKIKKGIPYAIRFKVDPKEIVVEDIVQGKVKFDSRLIGDFIIVKSDGFPSYNYAVVIDDFEMKITHVIRGVGHLSNTPRQILIHEAFGFPLPKYAHISEIVGTDKKKLSKRRGATSVMFFKELGYLPEAMVNYMALLGWYPEDGVEFMPDGEIMKKFDIYRCSKSPAMFDFFLIESIEKSEKSDTKEETDESSEFSSQSIQEMTLEEIKQIINPKTKLNWMNQKYIRHFSSDKIFELSKEFLLRNEELKLQLEENEEKIKQIFQRIKDYLVTLDEAVLYIKELLSDQLELTEEASQELEELEKQFPNTSELIEVFLTLLNQTTPKSEDDYKLLIKKCGEQTQRKGKFLYMPIRIYTTGKTHGMELPILFTLLGKERIFERVVSLKKLVKT